MKFCKNCGKGLFINNPETNIVQCSCGYIEKIERGHDVGFEEKIPQKAEIGKGAVTEKHDLHGFPHICKKCSHGEAEAIELGVFYGDEAGVYLFKCKKCGYTERQSDGTGN
jgi:DNA-directed RNA polymerase subunit M/transcription elongation factor TFIIS